MTLKPDGKELSPEAELRAFINRFDPKEQRIFRSVRAAVRKRFPTATELAYDYSDSVVIAYSSTDRGIDGIAAIALLMFNVQGSRVLMHSGGQPEGSPFCTGKNRQLLWIQVSPDLAEEERRYCRTSIVGKV